MVLMAKQKHLVIRQRIVFLVRILIMLHLNYLQLHLTIVFVLLGILQMVPSVKVMKILKNK